MKWADAMDALVAEVKADAELLTVLGGARIYRAGERRKPEIPSVEWTVIASTLEETAEPVLTQWDMFAAESDTLIAIEARLRRRLHWPIGRVLAGIHMTSQYESGRDHPDPESGVHHRSLDFIHQPVRDRGW